MLNHVCRTQSAATSGRPYWTAIQSSLVWRLIYVVVSPLVLISLSLHSSRSRARHQLRHVQISLTIPRSVSPLGLYKEGHALFRDTPETFPVPFIEGDVFDSAFLEIQPPITKENAPTEPAPALASLTSLNPLRGHVSAVFMGKFLHLFDEAGQAHIARALAGLLSPEPGSMIFGVQGALEKRGQFKPTGSEFTMFCHSPESLGKVFEDAFGGPGRIKFESRLTSEPGGPTYFDTWPGNTKPFICQEWSVTRL